MEKITYTQFRASLKRYLDLIRAGAEYEVSGTKLTNGTCKHVLTYATPPISAAAKENDTYVPSSRTLLDQKRIDESRVEQTILEEPRCDKCKNNLALFAFFQDGEDYKVCMACIKKYSIRNFKPL